MIITDKYEQNKIVDFLYEHNIVINGIKLKLLNFNQTTFEGKNNVFPLEFQMVNKPYLKINHKIRSYYNN